MIGIKNIFLFLAILHYSFAITRNELLLEEIVYENQKLLRTPTNLNETVSTPRKFLDAERKDDQWDKLIVGVLVENYSKYILSDPSTSGVSNCGANHEIHNVTEVKPGSTEFFAVDNDGWDHYGICGAFSWQIRKPDGTANIVSDLVFDKT